MPNFGMLYAVIL